jgi:ABC-type transport system involved in multi-copper enzyme maturation permease subunit
MSFFPALTSTFSIFFRLGFRKKRTRLFVFLSFMPLLLLAVIVAVGAFVESRDFSAPIFFSKIAPTYYLQFLVGIVAVFFSTSVLAEELDEKTLPYLTSRPAPKGAVLLGKFTAYYVQMGIVLMAGVICSFVAANWERLHRWVVWEDFLQFCFALLLALFTYGAVFLGLSTFMKRTVLFGLVYLFGFESFVQYLPGFTQKLTIIHYVKSLTPQAATEYSFLVVRLEPSSLAGSIVTLLLIALAAMGLGWLIFSRKEYVV